jgi:hypothetical protein
MTKLLDHAPGFGWNPSSVSGEGATGNRNASIEAARGCEVGVGKDAEADRERKVEKPHAEVGQLAWSGNF